MYYQGKVDKGEHDERYTINMSNHIFTFIAVPRDLDFERVANALFESGCDDATVSVSGGKMHITFDRESSNYVKAIDSAKRDIKAAGVNVLTLEGEGRP